MTSVTVVRKIPQPLNKKITEPLNIFFLLSQHFLKEQFETFDLLLERLQDFFVEGLHDFLVGRLHDFLLLRACVIFCLKKLRDL